MRARLLVLVVLAVAMPAGAWTSQPRGTGAPATPVPPGWADTTSKIRALVLDGRHQEVVALTEPFIAKYPLFADAHFWFGSAHENMGRDLVRTDKAAARGHFETAESHYRQTFDLGCGAYPDACIRGLVDLYEYALARPDRWKATVLEAATRYPREPVTHWYAVQLLLREDRLADLDGTLRAARSALPPSPEPRLEFASLLVGLADRGASGAARIALANEAVALSTETLKAHSADSVGRRAQSIRDDALKVLARNQTYPPPFPRLGVMKVFENDYVVVWDAQFPKDVHTGMHEHRRDTAAYFVTAGQVIATFADGTVRRNDPFPSGHLLFNSRGVIHSEQWISEGTKAIAMELKADMLPSSPSPGIDPLTAEPAAHRVLLENERVRVLETVQRAGMTLREHVHPARMIVRAAGCEGLAVPASASRTSGGPQVWWAGAESHSHQAPATDCRSLEFEVKGAR